MDEPTRERDERALQERLERQAREPEQADERAPAPERRTPRVALRGPLELVLFALISVVVAGMLVLRTTRPDPSVDERLKRIEERLDRIAAEQEAAAARRAR